MPSPAPRERLQPSLFDRLEDDLGSAIDRLRDIVRILAHALDPATHAALGTLLADERLQTRPPTEAELAPFAGLDAELQGLVQEAIRLERHRRTEQQRVFVISTDRLRAACLHDLQCLFNETDGEAELDPDLLATIPTVRASVLNYGLPALTGSVRTPEQIADLGRDIARVLERFEPRIRNVRVTRDDRTGTTPPGRSGGDGIDRIGYLIEGELWGYPYDERLRIRTLLDLDLGRLTLLNRPEEPPR
jgi:type VI secretion system protein ImpF